MQTPIVTLARVARAAQRRGLATNLRVLSVADLKQEAKRRGLSSSGNKATLITRIQHVGKRVDDSTANDASSRSLATATAAQVASHRPTLDVKLPDLSPLPDTDGPHIPFLPDFWDSSRVRTPDAIHHSPAADSPLPQVLIVSGTRASSPTYNYSHHPESDEVRDTVAPSAEKAGFWADVASDLGLPRSSDLSASLSKTRDAVLSFAQNPATQDRSGNRSSTSSRPLDADESRGLWVVLAVLGGSWLAGGFFGPPKKKTTAN